MLAPGCGVQFMRPTASPARPGGARTAGARAAAALEVGVARSWEAWTVRASPVP